MNLLWSAFNREVRFANCSQEEGVLMLSSTEATENGFEDNSGLSEFAEHLSSGEVEIDDTAKILTESSVHL